MCELFKSLLCYTSLYELFEYFQVKVGATCEKEIWFNC